MARRDDHDQLLGAYALDAVDPNERAEIEAYLAQTPEASAEVDRYHAAIVALADVELTISMPEGLWDRVSGAMFSGGADANRDADIVPLRLPPIVHPEPVRGRPAPPARPARRRRAGLALAAAAALIVAALAGFALRSRPAPQSADKVIAAAARKALEDPASHVGSLDSTTGTPSLRAVVDKDGRGYLYADSLPALPTGRTYQLWTLDSGSPVSLGVIGNRPLLVAFTANQQTKTLALSVENEPGAVAPSAPIASGALK